MCKTTTLPSIYFVWMKDECFQQRQAIMRNSVTEKLLQPAQTEGRVNPNLSNHKPKEFFKH